MRNRLLQLSLIDNAHRLTFASRDLSRADELDIAGDPKRGPHLVVQSFLELDQVFLIAVDFGGRFHKHIEFIHVVRASIHDNLVVRLNVPHLQKEIIRQARAAKVPVIVATQMLESMVTHLRPTRAEVSDVATAIFDGADAIMLSAETASGRYPHEAVEVMSRVAVRAEKAVLTMEPMRRRRTDTHVGFPEAVSNAAAMAANALDARAIVAFTQSGFSARLISHQRPEVPIIAFTPTVEVQRRLALSWGVSSRLIGKVETTDEMVEAIESALLGDGSVAVNDVLVIISGAPMWVTGTTNLMRLHRVGERR